MIAAYDLKWNKEKKRRIRIKMNEKKYRKRIKKIEKKSKKIKKKCWHFFYLVVYS